MRVNVVVMAAAVNALTHKQMQQLCLPLALPQCPAPLELDSLQLRPSPEANNVAN